MNNRLYSKKYFSFFLTVFLCFFFVHSAFLTPKRDNKEKNMNVYTESMELILAANANDESAYKQHLNKMLKKIDTDNPFNLKDPTSFQAWLYGRILLCAEKMKDAKTENQVLPKMKELIKKGQKNEFLAWALGYLAALNRNEYASVKDNMLQSAQNKKLQPNDAIWAWVMISQAAARAQDQEIFQFALTKIKALGKKPSLGDALLSLDHKDYSAWAIAIVRSAALTINSSEIYNSLETPLQRALKGSEDYELSLARSTEQTQKTLPNASIQNQSSISNKTSKFKN